MLDNQIGKTCLKLWDYKLEKAVKEKQQAYNNYLQKFFSDIENDVHERQYIAYNLIRHKNQEQKDTAQISFRFLSSKKCETHYKNL